MTAGIPKHDDRRVLEEVNRMMLAGSDLEQIRIHWVALFGLAMLALDCVPGDGDRQALLNEANALRHLLHAGAESATRARGKVAAEEMS